jgi:hypothetical protein
VMDSTHSWRSSRGSRQRAEMVAAVAAAFQADALTRGAGEAAQHDGRDRSLGRALQQGRRAFGIRPCPVARCLQSVDVIFQCRVVKIGDAATSNVLGRHTLAKAQLPTRSHIK